MSENIEKAPNVPPFVQFVCSAVPMVFDDSLSYYEALSALWKYLQNTVDVVNNNATVTEEYIQLTKDLEEYINHYFDNLNVQAEINIKLDAMAEDGTFAAIFNEYFEDYINPTIEQQNRRIATVEDQVSSAVSSAPVAVSNTSDMTDHNKIYVNTSDGKWYYWNSGTSTWTAGGTYQATSLGANSVGLGNLDAQLAEQIFESFNDITKCGNIRFNSNANSYNFTTPMIMKAGTTVTFSEDFVANYHYRFKRVSAIPVTIAQSNENISNELTDSSYTFTNTEYCVFSWRPIDNNWNSETYTVDRDHKLDNDDITSITYYLPKDEHFKVIDGNSTLMFNKLFGCVNYGTSDLWQYSASRLTNCIPYYSNYEILFHCKSGYQYDYSVFDGGGMDANRTSHTGWTTGDILIPANTYFSITIRKSDNSNFLFTDYDFAEIIQLNSYANYNYVDDYIDSHISSIGTTYNYEGINLDLQYKHGYEYTTSTPLDVSLRGIQGFTVYGNYIFQMYSSSTLRILDKATGAVVAEHTGIGTDHGGTCAFSNIYVDPNDDFPLLFVSSSYNNTDGGQIVSIRIQDVNTVSRYKFYHFDISQIGYWSEQCYDFETGLVYSFGYTQNSFSDSTNNPVIVCVYDLNKETQIASDLYTLELVDRYTIPFVYCIQSCKFLNGLCYMPSSYQSHVSPTDLKVFDPNRKTFVANFPNLPTPLQGEMEDIAFVKNNTTGKYDMIVGISGDSNYWKVSFM